jgi:hypothetical protein
MECNAQYADLDAMARDADNIPGYCWAEYTLSTFSPMLEQVLQQYTSAGLRRQVRLLRAVHQ